MPLAIGKGVDQAEHLVRHVLGAGYYHHKRAAVMALCAVEMAMWDALGKHAGLPLHRLWGGAYRSEIDFAAYLFINDTGRVAEAARSFADRGYRSFKLKIGVDEPSDIALTRAVRKAVGDAVPLRVDVNGAWTPGTARRQCAKLAEFDLSYVEQPLELDDLAGHADLRRNQSIPIALDESAYTLADVGNIVRMGAADVILLDPHEAGGLWQCVKAAAVAESVGIPVTLHSGGELGISQAAYLHLAASIPEGWSISIDTEHDYLGDDVIAPASPSTAGGLPSPPAPLGVGGRPVATRPVSRRAHRRGAPPDPQAAGWVPDQAELAGNRPLPRAGTRRGGGIGLRLRFVCP
ncbi:MAG: mandelate racemase/muconate lactonizing enzyme family protein [Betaproteobacteria bacterium]|nr:mandelate racemase/muconate lactonizing enzyme family protein [Betaproteobacteria bacterium]